MDLNTTDINALNIDTLLHILSYLDNIFEIRCLLSSYLELAKVVNSSNYIKRQIKERCSTLKLTFKTGNELKLFFSEEEKGIHKMCCNSWYNRDIFITSKHGLFKIYEKIDFRGMPLEKYVTYLGDDIPFYFINYQDGEKVSIFGKYDINHLVAITPDPIPKPILRQDEHIIKSEWKYGVLHGMFIKIHFYGEYVYITILKFHYGVHISSRNYDCCLSTFEEHSAFERTFQDDTKRKEGYCDFLVAKKGEYRFCSRKVTKGEFCTQHAKKLGL